MEIVNVKENSEYLSKYIELCSYEWGRKKTELEMQKYVEEKKKSILIGEKVISILELL